MSDLQLLLRDRNRALCLAWQQAFAGVPNVSVSCGDILNLLSPNHAAIDAMVSPANSFGFMDGGLDFILRDFFGRPVEASVRHAIARQFDGEMPVGNALIVPTQHAQIPFLVCAPTMRVPENVGQTVNAYLALRAALIAVRQFNAARQGQNAPRIRRVLCPGLCTAVGRMDPVQCARQMRAAYDAILQSPSPPQALPEWTQVILQHRHLLDVAAESDSETN